MNNGSRTKMRTNTKGRELFGEVGGTWQWVAVSSILGCITVGSGIGLIAMAIYLLTQSALLGTAASLSLTILGVRFFAVTRVVGRYCERYLGHLGTFRVLTNLRVWFFERLITNDAVTLSNQRRGDLTAAIVDDVETMQHRLLRVSSPPIVAVGTLAIGSIALAAIDIPSAAVLVSFFAFGAIVLPRVLRAQTQKQAAQLVNIRAERLTEATELLDGRETLLIWGRTDLLATSLSQFDRRESEVSQQLSRTRALLSATTIGVSTLCVLSIVAVLGSTNDSSPTLWWIGAAPLIALSSFEALGPLLTVPDFRAQTNAAASRILDFAESTSVKTDSPAADPMLTVDIPKSPSIEISNLSFSYGEELPVFTNARLEIPFGTAVAIAAPSGAGKSTLVDLLTGLLATQADSVAIGGLDPVVLNRQSRPCVVAVLQHDHVFDTTIRDNLLVGNGDASDEQLLRACETACFLPVVQATDEGLNAPIGPNGNLLSGGERQRLILARALLADTPILLLDEVTEHLEPDLRSEIVDNLLRERQGKTTVFLAHDIDSRSGVDLTYDIAGGTFILREN